MYDFSYETHKESRFPSLQNQLHCLEYKIGHELFLSNLPQPEESEQRQAQETQWAASHDGMRRSTAEPPSQRQFVQLCNHQVQESRLEPGSGWHQGIEMKLRSSLFGSRWYVTACGSASTAGSLSRYLK